MACDGEKINHEVIVCGTAPCQINLINPILGVIIPFMGSITTGLSDALFSKTQRKLLALLFGHPDRSYFANEIVRHANSGIGAVQRELERLTRVGLLTVAPVGNQKHYRANPASPIYEELRGIVTKTFGVTDVLRDALAPLAKKIHVAFVYGSIAKGSESAASDVDVLIVSNSLTYADLFGALEEVSVRLGRKVNPTVYSPQELEKLVKQGNAFATRVLAQPKIWLLGNESDLDA